MLKEIKVCIYGLGTYELLTCSEQKYIGGAEVQQSMLAKGLLSAINMIVSVIVYDCGQPRYQMLDGIHIYKTVPKGYSINSTGSLLNVLVKTFDALNKCNSDIYYCRIAGIDVGFVALFCKLKRKKFVLGLSSNKDLNGEYLKNASFCEKMSYRLGIKLADQVICQSKDQLHLLKSNFYKNSVVINNMHKLPEEAIIKKNPPIVIWVGTVKPEWKQPEIFLKLAREIPEAKFQMIGGPSENIVFYEKIKREASEIQNLEFVGFVPFPQINKYFSDASLLINTSSVEGFPNTYIQSWMRYTPVVSLNVDPDGIISKHQLGFHSKNFAQMVKDVRYLLNNDDLRNRLGENSKKYAECEFDSNKNIPKYLSLFGELVDRQS
jgi:glycosyltransferase involved in cell wall biosynthesis